MSTQVPDLVDMVRQLRVAIARHARGGAWAASAAPTSRSHGEVSGGNADTHISYGREPHDNPATHAGVAIDGRVAMLERVGALATVQAELGDCQRCGLCVTRNQIVFGSGAAATALMFVGGAPGLDDDQTGMPFVGKAGELLDKMIVAMGWQRNQVYVGNVVGCRPPEDQAPALAHVAACQPFMLAQVGVVAPKIIVALGQVAANVLLGDAAPISASRGRFYARNIAGHDVLIMPTYHPTELLQTPELKRPTWADLQLVIAELAKSGK